MSFQILINEFTKNRKKCILKKMSADRTIIYGLSNVGLRIAEFMRLRGYSVIVVAPADSEHLEKMENTGIEVVIADIKDLRTMENSGLGNASSLVLVSEDDQFNLQAALHAAEINKHIKIIMRAFNTNLARKIEESITNVKVISVSRTASPGFAGSALLNKHVFSFRTGNDIVCFFETKGASLLDCPEKVSDIEEKKDVKIAAVNGKIISDGEDVINISDNILCFSTLMQAKDISGINGRIHTPSKPAKEWRHKEMFSSLIPSDSILTGTLLTLAAIVVCCVVFFHFSENLSIISSVYFVVTILTTVGFGDINLKDSSDIAKIVGIILMMSGTVLLGTIFAIFTNSMVKKRIELLMGHRKMKLRNHTIVCGLGDVGMRILENLLLADEQVVIIEKNPENRFIQNLRGMGVSFVIADAALEETLINAAVEQAKAIICATDDDMNNLETGLNALGLNKHIKVVLRIFDKVFAEKIEKNFAIHCAISSSYIAAPFFVSALDDTRIFHSINSGGKELFVAQGRIEDENLCKELIMKENIKPLMVVDENDMMTFFKDDLLKKGSRLFYITDNANN